MGFYEEMRDEVASPLLAEFAQGTVTLTRSVDTGTPIDADAPWLGNVVTTTVYTLDAVVKGVSKEFVDGTTILATDLEVTAAVFGAEPAPADTMAIDGQTVTIIKTMRVPAAGTIVAWKFVVRG